MTEQSEHEALEALFADLHGTKDSIPLHRYTIKWRDRRDRFTTMLDAEAYLDAAMMLVPEGYDFATGSGRPQAMDPNARGPWAWVAAHGDLAGDVCREETPALALCAAIEATIARAGE